MKLIVGLGNPDKKYENTRHNIGFRCLDAMIEIEQFRDLTFKPDQRFFGHMAKNQSVILLKPMTYMNKSGQSVQAVRHYFKINLSDILLVHDDMDLEFGQLKLQFAKSAAGHNGVDSVINHIGSKEFWRLRLGINNEIKSKMAGDKFVISSFSPEEEKKIKGILETSLDFMIEFINAKKSELTNKNYQIPV